MTKRYCGSTDQGHYRRRQRDVRLCCHGCAFSGAHLKRYPADHGICNSYCNREVLLLTTNSWFEPVLFMITIGIAIILNMGTNLIFGEISFVTNAAGSVLQLAVSMDYSIFLLHRFSENRSQGKNVQEAMIAAVKQSIGSVMSSGLTTVTGFAALILMRFRISRIWAGLWQRRSH